MLTFSSTCCPSLTRSGRTTIDRIASILPHLNPFRSNDSGSHVPPTPMHSYTDALRFDTPLRTNSDPRCQSHSATPSLSRALLSAIALAYAYDERIYRLCYRPSNTTSSRPVNRGNLPPPFNNK